MLLPKLKSFTDRSGFTMIELLVVIAVIGVLAVAVLSSINPIEQVNKGRDTRTRSDAAQLLNAIDRFFAIHERYPWNDAKYNDALANNTLYTAAFPDAAVCTATTQQAGPPYVPGGFCLIDNSQEGTSAAPSWLQALTLTEEVKQGIIDRLTTAGSSTTMEGALYIYKAASSGVIYDDVHVCFQPSSKAFQDQAVESCIEDYVDGGSISDHPPGACPQGSYTTSTAYANELICLP